MKMKHRSLLAFLFLASCSEGIVEQFRDCCSNCRALGFEKELAQLVPVGARSSDFEELLAIADERIPHQSSTTYVFRDATGAFSEQGLVITILVDPTTETITAVNSAVAAY